MYARCRSGETGSDILVVVEVVVDVFEIWILQVSFVSIMGASSFLVSVIPTLIVRKVSARVLIGVFVDPVIVVVVFEVEGDIMLGLSLNGMYSCREFLNGSIPIKQSNSYSGKFSLNHLLEFLDQELKFSHFSLTGGVRLLTKSRNLASDDLGEDLMGWFTGVF